MVEFVVGLIISAITRSTLDAAEARLIKFDQQGVALLKADQVHLFHPLCLLSFVPDLMQTWT